MQITQHHLCRACRGNLHEAFSLGNLKLNAFPDTPTGHLQLASAPLRVMVCENCTLVQLGETVEPDVLYRQYWYRSSVNEMMRKELANIALDGLMRTLHARRVLDIGANDGTLLGCYPKMDRKVGIDPAVNLQGQLAQHAEAICGYFPKAADDFLAPGEQFDLITAIACAYDLEEPLKFFQGIARRLAPGGRACVQFQDLQQQIQSNAWDNICHEHLEYYSLTSLNFLCIQAGLRLIDVVPRAINGGSLRVWLAPLLEAVKREDLEGQRRVFDHLKYEAMDGYGQGDIFPVVRDFGKQVQRTTQQIRAAVQQVHDQGGEVDLYGASTKGNILLQVAGLGPEQIRQAIDRDPTKDGRYTVTGIPIGDEEATKDGPPAMARLIPIWQFRPSVLERNQAYLARGGSLIFPLPRVEIVQGVLR